MKSKQAKVREFGQKARKEISMRDFGKCIFCTMNYHMEDVSGFGQQVLSIMHYIPRSKNGLGIPQNGAIGCQCHHDMFDNGKSGRRDEMQSLFRDYLKNQYPNWDENELIYSKWRFLEEL